VAPGLASGNDQRSAIMPLEVCTAPGTSNRAHPFVSKDSLLQQPSYRSHQQQPRFLQQR
jgi:hypothetical protein